MNNRFQKRLKLGLAKVFAIICCTQISLVWGETCWVSDSDIQGFYSGSCKDGKAHGFGIAIGRDIYKGEFRDGLKHGKDTYVWDESVKHDPCCRGSSSILYIGEYDNDLRHGNGTMIYFNGNSYEGEFKYGTRVGKTRIDLESETSP